MNPSHQQPNIILITTDQDFGELYDLANDPREKVNHWSDAAYARDKADLLSRLPKQAEPTEAHRRSERYGYA